MTRTLENKNKQILITAFLLITGISIPFFSCSKFVEVNTPTTSIDAKNVYTNDLTAASVLTGIYTTMSTQNIPNLYITSVGFVTGLSGDELTLYDGSSDVRLKSYYQNDLINNTSTLDFWSTIYSQIYVTNISIEQLTKATSLTPRVKQQLIGEAKFTRAFFYFYLVNMYGDVPLVLSTNYATNSILYRSPKDKIWAQIILDLNDAKVLLASDYLDGTLLNNTTERVRPTKWAATALLSRSYLYTHDWENAEIQSNEIIKNASLFNLDSLNQVFLKNSRESIWQLQPVNYSSNTEDGKAYILPSTGPSFMTPAYLSDQLLNSFESDDLRKTIWIDTAITSSGKFYFYAFKYRSGSLDDPLIEYNTVLRLGEQFLIRAEARAQLNKISDAQDDLNVIRERAGLKKITLIEKNALLAAIYHERQVELFTEWGHRWFDLKRNQQIDSVMSKVTPIKGGSWNSNWQLFPIPSYDLIQNGNLIQNSGY